METRCEEIKTEGYEQVIYFEDLRAGLKTLVAIHNTNLGPACGGIRLYPYGSREEALQDVLRLAKGMSYKSALAGIGFGGGKSVIIEDPSRKSPELFQAFGGFVDSLGGKYICAKDMNVESEDLLEVKKKTPHILGIDGEAGSGGDPSPVTARAAFGAIRAVSEIAWNTKSLSDIKVAIQGVGHVGFALAELIHAAGGELWVSDVDADAVKRAEEELGAHAVTEDEIFSVECDIFSPCAIGAILSEETIPRLKCKAVVGCANNQLEREADGVRLNERGILYAPDFAVNSGGIINCFVEYEGYDQERAFLMADKVYDTVKAILLRAKSEKTPPSVIADLLAEERMYG